MSKMIQLRTAEDLEKLRSQPNENFELLEDLDLKGEIWKPAVLRGSLSGNGKSISNFVIFSDDATEVGFFSTIDSSASVTDLHLREIRVYGGAYTGILAGTNGGSITGCTVTGHISDVRPDACVGCIVGRNAGKVEGGTCLTATAGTENPRDVAEGLAAAVILDVKTEKVGLVGENSGIATGLWQDLRNHSGLLSETEQARREKVVSYVYKMATTAWQPREYMCYTPPSGVKGVHYQPFQPGQTYYGLPYSFNASSLERFMSCLDENNVVTPETKALGLDSAFLKAGESFTDASGTYAVPENGYYGFVQYMGGDCSSAVQWGWQQISPTRVRNADGTPHGGVYLHATRNISPGVLNQAIFGVRPVGTYQTDMKPTHIERDENGHITGAFYDTNLFYQAAGPQGLAETYALAHRGDGLVGHDAKMDGDKVVSQDGHARLLACDPVIIRDAEGTIDLVKSYCITIEQGDGLYQKEYDKPHTSWRAHYVYSLDALLNHEHYSGVSPAYSLQMVGSKHRYVPITMEAFTAKELPRVVVTEHEDHLVAAPNSGWICCNYYIIRVKMTVKDSTGAVVYEKTAYNNVGATSALYRTNGGVARFERLFADAPAALRAGESYTFAFTVTTSNGQTVQSETYTCKV